MLIHTLWYAHLFFGEKWMNGARHETWIIKNENFVVYWFKNMIGLHNIEKFGNDLVMAVNWRNVLNFDARFVGHLFFKSNFGRLNLKDGLWINVSCLLSKIPVYYQKKMFMKVSY